MILTRSSVSLIGSIVDREDFHPRNDKLTERKSLRCVNSTAADLSFCSFHVLSISFLLDDSIRNESRSAFSSSRFPRIAAFPKETVSVDANASLRETREQMQRSNLDDKFCEIAAGRGPSMSGPKADSTPTRVLVSLPLLARRSLPISKSKSE